MPSARAWIDAEEEHALQDLEFAEDQGNLLAVRVHDVGQGNGNALFSSGQPHPILYFDVGCGAHWNAATCPGQLTYDFADQPWIILSHWDFDHWWAGYNQMWDHASQCEWLAPRQEVSALHQRIAHDLGDKIRVWPNQNTAPAYFRESITAITGNDRITISRCTGPADGDRNDSGLAITIKKRIATAPPAHDLVLLPGDAPYTEIPLPQGSWAGLVATHHGSRTNVVDHNDQPLDIPRAAQGRCPTIVYSAGLGTRYGHPNLAAVTAYGLRGWQTDRTQEQSNGEYSYRSDTAYAGGRGDQVISFVFE